MRNLVRFIVGLVVMSLVLGVASVTMSGVAVAAPSARDCSNGQPNDTNPSPFPVVATRPCRAVSPDHHWETMLPTGRPNVAADYRSDNSVPINFAALKADTSDGRASDRNSKAQIYTYTSALQAPTATSSERGARALRIFGIGGYSGDFQATIRDHRGSHMREEVRGMRPEMDSSAPGLLPIKRSTYSVPCKPDPSGGLPVVVPAPVTVLGTGPVTLPDISPGDVILTGAGGVALGAALALAADRTDVTLGVTAVEAGAAAIPVVHGSAPAAGFGRAFCTISGCSPNVFRDSHLVTLDGCAYGWQNTGEFTLTDVPTTGLHIQGRFISSGNAVSVMQRVAFNASTQRVEFDSSGAVLVDGDPTAIPDDGVYALIDGSYIIRSGIDRIAVLAVDDTVISNISGAVGIKLPGSVRSMGLLGNHDGDYANDRVTAWGEELPADPAANVLYGRFADSWRVTDTTSLFTYPAGKSTADFTDRTFPRIVTTLASLSVGEPLAAAAVCAAHGLKWIFDIVQAAR